MLHAPLSSHAKAVLHAARERFALEPDGIHGIAHWGRVRTNGLRLAALTGANPKVVDSFALLHDCCRENDGEDSGHGERAAAFAEYLCTRRVLLLDTTELELLTTACRWHSFGSVLDDVTISTCWDADRLDLGRIGIRPDPARLCTDAARDAAFIEWAWRRSLPRSKGSAGEPEGPPADEPAPTRWRAPRA